MGDKSYVRTDEQGALRVGRTDVLLDCVFAAWQQGHSPEAIKSQYPAMSIEEVYGAITWCLAHPGEMDQYRRRQEAVWDRWRNRAQADAKPVVARLRDFRKAGTLKSLIGGRR
jgi:uncharacterized protein (DUF433 family)